jgi:hypothetical protein
MGAVVSNSSTISILSTIYSFIIIGCFILAVIITIMLIIRWRDERKDKRMDEMLRKIFDNDRT